VVTRWCTELPGWLIDGSCQSDYRNWEGFFRSQSLFNNKSLL